MRKTHFIEILVREKSYLLGETFKNDKMSPLLSLAGVATSHAACVNG